MSDRRRVVVADPMTAEFKKRWMEDLDGLPVDLVLLEDPSPGAFRDAVADADILITRNREIDRETVEQAGPSVRMLIKLSRWSVGIDMDACSKRGIQVIHVPQLACITVAEHAMTLMLMCARDMIRSHLGVIAGGYRDCGMSPEVTSERSFAFKWMPVQTGEVYGKVLGIVGFGEIGKELAARAKGFGMRILYFDQQEAPEEIEAELGAQYEDLDALLVSSDFISLHIPHTPATEKLINADLFRRMKPTAFLLNACRGGVVDEEAMVDALKTGRIAGAGLDVFVEEPLPYDHPLTQLENVVLTPHIGGGSGTGRADQKRRLRELISKVSP